jgi:lysophospholipase L1-like esterase
MAYTKKTWATGDTITATALNNIENGVGNAHDLIGNKADSTNVYTKTEVDTKLTSKVDSTSVYTKTEVDTKVAAVSGGTSTASVIYNKRKMVITGDSITDMNRSGRSAQNTTSQTGFIDWGNLLCNHYFDILNNDGVSGDKTTGVLSRFDANVLSYNPDYIHVMIGINDVGVVGATAAGIIANLTQIYTKALNSGAILIIGTLTTSASFTDAQKVILTTINGWIRQYAKTTHNVILADYYTYVCDSATGFLKSGWTADGTHPTNIMAYAMGNCFKNAVAPYIKDVKTPEGGFAVDAANILTNAAFNGTTTPTGWSISGTNTKAIVVPTDFINTNYLSVDITSGNYVQVSQSVTIASGKIAEGDTVYASVEVIIDSMTNFNVMTLEIDVMNGSYGTLASAKEFTDPQTGTFTMTGFSAKLMTKKVTIPTGQSAANVSLMFKVSGEGNVKFRNPAIIKC